MLHFALISPSIPARRTGVCDLLDGWADRLTYCERTAGQRDPQRTKGHPAQQRSANHVYLLE
jgi:hypothetical protein